MTLTASANVSYSPIFGVIIPITICARCGGDSKYCTCAIVTAARGLPCGIQISGPPQDDRKITSRDTRRIIFISLGCYWSRRSAAKRKTEGKRVHQTADWRVFQSRIISEKSVAANVKERNDARPSGFCVSAMRTSSMLSALCVLSLLDGTTSLAQSPTSSLADTDAGDRTEETIAAA